MERLEDSQSNEGLNIRVVPNDAGIVPTTSREKPCDKWSREIL